MDANIEFKNSVKIEAQFLANIEPYLTDRKIIKTYCDFNADLIILTAKAKEDENIYSNKNGMFFDQKRKLEIIKLSAENNYEPELIELVKTGLCIDHFQPLSNNRWILSTDDSPYRTYGDKINAFILNLNKKIDNFLHTGSDIMNFQATKDDLIWIGYHVNGIFGHNDISFKKLVCIDSCGKILFDFRKSMEKEILESCPDEDGNILDLFESCDGLNITLDSEVWVYWLGDCDSLIKIKDFKLEAIYTKIPAFFYYEFAVYEDWVLFSQIPDQICLYSLKNRDVYKIIPVNKAGEVLNFNYNTARDKITYILNNGICYKIDLADILKQIII